MATIRARRAMSRRLLEAIGNQSAEELGRLAIDLMQNTETIYRELKIDDPAEGDEFDYDFQPLNRSEDIEREYRRLHEEYSRRFAGVPESQKDPEIPLDQPPADDITIGVEPNSGRVVEVEGNGIEDIVKEEDIFEEV